MEEPENEALNYKENTSILLVCSHNKSVRLF